MLILTMHFSLRHFVLKRSIAFWFLSENLNIWMRIHFNQYCNSLVPRYDLNINLRVSLSHRNSSRSRRGQNFARLLKQEQLTKSRDAKIQPVDHVVDMDLGGDGLGCAHHKDRRVSQLGNVSVPQGVRHMAHSFEILFINNISFSDTTIQIDASIEFYH